MIWILGGSTDSYGLCQSFNKEDRAYKLTVITDYKRDMPLSYTSKALSAPLSEEEMIAFIRKNKITTLIDSTHEQAITVSKCAIRASNKCNIRYIRYDQRPGLKEINYSKLYYGLSLKEMVQAIQGHKKNIFLSVGRKELKYLIPELKAHQCFVQIPPASRITISCEDLGLNTKELIGLKEPLSVELNTCLFKDYKVDLVITKEGQGLREKIKACQSLNLPIMVLKTKMLEYPYVSHTIEMLKCLII